MTGVAVVVGGKGKNMEALASNSHCRSWYMLNWFCLLACPSWVPTSTQVLLCPTNDEEGRGGWRTEEGVRTKGFLTMAGSSMGTSPLL